MRTHTESETHYLKDENKRLKTLLAQSQLGENDWYKTLFNNNKEAIVVCETFSGFPSTIVDCNSQFLSLMKEGFEDLIGRDFMDLMRKGEKQRFLIQALNKKKNDDIENLPFIFISGHGEELSMEISTHFFQDERGRLSLITLHPENTHKAILNRGIERLLSDSNQVFFSIKEENTLIFDYLSFSVLKVTGFSADQLKLNPLLFWNNCHPGDLKKIKTRIRQEEQGNNKYKLRFIRRDGQMIWLEISLLIPPKNGDQTVLYAVAREITAQQKVKRLSKKKEWYDQTILQLSQSFIHNFNLNTFKHQSRPFMRQLQAERFSIFVTGNTSADLSLFSPEVTLEEKTYVASNKATWEEFEPKLQETPLLLYHPKEDIQNLGEEHHSFFSERNIQSALVIPLKQNNISVGFVSISTIKHTKHWDRTDINFLSQLTDLLSIVLIPQA